MCKVEAFFFNIFFFPGADIVRQWATNGCQTSGIISSISSIRGKFLASY